MSQRDEQSFAEMEKSLRERAAARPFAQQIAREILAERFGCVEVRLLSNSGAMGPVIMGEDAKGVRRAYKFYLPKPDFTPSPEFKRCQPEASRKQILHEAFANERAALEDLKGADHVVQLHKSLPLDVKKGLCGVLVLDYLNGWRLDRLIQRAGTLPEKQAKKIADEVLFGLAFLAKAGWVHGDVCPRNVIVREDGPATLIDFSSALKEGTMRSKSLAMATREFAAAEMLEESGQPVTCKADVYSLKRVRDLMLEGRLPIEAWKEEMDKAPAGRRSDWIAHDQTAQMIETGKSFAELEAANPAPSLKKDEGLKLKEKKKPEPEPESGAIVEGEPLPPKKKKPEAEREKRQAELETCDEEPEEKRSAGVSIGPPETGNAYLGDDDDDI